MAAKKSADQWFADYGDDPVFPTPGWVHWLCVPLIFTCVLGFFWALPVPEAWFERVPWFNWALVAMALVMGFYVRLSPALSAGMFFFISLSYAALVLLDVFAPWAVGKICVVGFMLAWTGQMIGRALAGGRSSLRRNLVFIFIGPAWLTSLVYRKLGQKY
jgi:hypothetical protein